MSSFWSGFWVFASGHPFAFVVVVVFISLFGYCAISDIAQAFMRTFQRSWKTDLVTHEENEEDKDRTGEVE